MVLNKRKSEKDEKPTEYSQSILQKFADIAKSETGQVFKAGI